LAGKANLFEGNFVAGRPTGQIGRRIDLQAEPFKPGVGGVVADVTVEG